MHVRPEIASLRSDKAKQARLREAMDAAQARWRARPQVAPLLAELRPFAAGTELGSLARLSELLGSLEHAEALVAQWCRDFLGPLRHEPLAQVLLRHHYGQGFATMRLASTERGFASKARGVHWARVHGWQRSAAIPRGRSGEWRGGWSSCN